MKPLTAATALLMAAAASASAQESTPTMSNDLTVTMGSRQNAICPGAPAQPEWIAQLHPRQAWRGVAMQTFYRFRADEQIVALNDCSCGVRFPEWTAAEEEFEERFGALDQMAQMDAFEEFEGERKAAKMAARTICRAQR